MARKRMFDYEIINQDSFLDLSMESKAIYFLLGMEADDEGFVAPKKILRLHGGNEKNLNELITKGFLISFNTGVVAITDWHRNNYLDKSRVKATIYQDEKSVLDYDDIKEKYVCLTNDKQMLNQYRIEENNIEKNRVEKGSIEKISGEIFTDTHNKKDETLKNEFDILWNLYPNKKSKSKALTYYISARKKGTSYEDIESGIYKYLDYIKSEKIDPKFIKHASTWFNQECWNDEYLYKKKTLNDISMDELNEMLKLEKEQKGENNNNDQIRIY